MTESLCSNCRNQLTGFDGGFDGLPVTCECKVYGETRGRKNCQHFKKKITKRELYEENKRLRECLDEADDIITSHLSDISITYWRNYCKTLGVDL